MDLGEHSFFPAHQLAMPGNRASDFENVALPHAASLLRYALHLASEKSRAEDRCGGAAGGLRFKSRSKRPDSPLPKKFQPARR